MFSRLFNGIEVISIPYPNVLHGSDFLFFLHELITILRTRYTLLLLIFSGVAYHVPVVLCNVTSVRSLS